MSTFTVDKLKGKTPRTLANENGIEMLLLAAPSLRRPQVLFNRVAIASVPDNRNYQKACDESLESILKGIHSWILFAQYTKPVRVYILFAVYEDKLALMSPGLFEACGGNCMYDNEQVLSLIENYNSRVSPEAL